MFGMGTGGALSLLSPESLLDALTRPDLNLFGFLNSIDGHYKFFRAQRTT